MDFLVSIFSNLWAFLFVVLFLGGSIFIHELGHFLAARWRRMHIVRFSIGFGPKIWGWRGQDGVEYRVSWLPFGGYVALPQLADLQGLEGDVPDYAANLPPASLADKVWVALAGPFFNILFAAVLATVVWLAGRPEPEHITSTTIGYVLPKIRLADGTLAESPAAKAGLRIGDKILAIDGRPIGDWPAVRTSLVLGTDVDPTGQRRAVLRVEREGQVLDVPVSPVRTGDEKFRQIGVVSSYQPILAKVPDDSFAAKLGLRDGDRLVTVEGKPLFGLEHLALVLDQAATETVALGVLRGGQTLQFALPKIDAKRTHPLDGVRITVDWRLRYQTPHGQFAEVVENTFRTLRSLVHPQGDLSLSNLSGPIGMGRNFWEAAKSDYPIRFAFWIAVLVNLSLAIFNLLPIPVLDGGHIALAALTRLRGKPPPINVVLATQSVFVVLLFGLMIYVTIFGDIRRMVSDYKADAQAREAVEQRKAQETKPAEPKP